MAKDYYRKNFRARTREGYTHVYVYGAGKGRMNCDATGENIKIFPNKNTVFISFSLGKYRRFYSDFNCRKNAIVDNQ